MVCPEIGQTGVGQMPQTESGLWLFGPGRRDYIPRDKTLKATAQDSIFLFDKLKATVQGQ